MSLLLIDQETEILFDVFWNHLWVRLVLFRRRVLVMGYDDAFVAGRDWRLEILQFVLVKERVVALVSEMVTIQ